MAPLHSRISTRITGLQLLYGARVESGWISPLAGAEAALEHALGVETELHHRTCPSVRGPGSHGCKQKPRQR